jgi:hypothetical protein
VKKEVVAVRKKILPGQMLTIKERIKYAGIIEQINVRFYAGQENELEILPYVNRKGQRIDTFFTYPEGTNPFLSGEDDRLSYPLSIPVENDDEIHLRVINRNTEYTYTLVVDVVVTYYAEPSLTTGVEV